MGRRIQYSLSTLILLVMFCGAVGVVWVNFSPWHPSWTIKCAGTVQHVFKSDDDEWLIFHSTSNSGDARTIIDVREARSGRRARLIELPEYFDNASISGDYLHIAEYRLVHFEGESERPPIVINFRTGERVSPETACGLEIVRGEKHLEVRRTTKGTTVTTVDFPDAKRVAKVYVLDRAIIAYAPDGLPDEHRFIVRVFDPKTGTLRFEHPGKPIWYSLDGAVPILFSPDGGAIVLEEDGNPGNGTLYSSETGKRIRVFGSDGICIVGNELIFDDTTNCMHDIRSGRELWKNEVYFHGYSKGELGFAWKPYNKPCIVEMRTGSVVVNLAKSDGINGQGEWNRLLLADDASYFVTYHPASVPYIGSGPGSDPGSGDACVWKLRRPWQWWGHLIRVEVWVAIVLAVLLGRRVYFFGRANQA